MSSSNNGLGERQKGVILDLDGMLAQGKMTDMGYQLAVVAVISQTPGSATHPVSTASPPGLHSAGTSTKSHKRSSKSSQPIPTGSRPGPSRFQKEVSKGKEPQHEPHTPINSGHGSQNPSNLCMENEGVVEGEASDPFEAAIPWNHDLDGEHLESYVEEHMVMKPRCGRITQWLHPTSHFQTREEAISHIKRLPSKYIQLYAKKKHFAVYGCTSHLACPSRIRVKKNHETAEFAIQYSAVEHSETHSDVSKARGLPQLLRAEVDRRVVAKDTPTKIYQDLRNHEDYKTFVADLDRHEFIKCIRNRKRTITRKNGGPLVFETCADLMNWAASHTFPDSTDAFLQCEETTLHVLPCGYRNDVRGVVFSSFKIVQNILKAQFDRPDNFTLMLDGTYKLHWGGWVVITVGVISLDWNRVNSGLSQSFRPVAYCFCESERKETITLLLHSVKELCSRLVPII